MLPPCLLIPPGVMPITPQKKLAESKLRRSISAKKFLRAQANESTTGVPLSSFDI